MVWMWAAVAWAAPFAGEPFEDSAAELLSAAEGGEAEWVDVLHEEERIVFDDQGRVVRTTWRAYQIRDAEAIEGWGYSEAGWQPWFQDRPVIQARVVRPDGQEFRLADADVVELAADGSDRLVYSDERRLRAPLPQVVAGAVIEELVVVTDHSPRFDAGRYVSVGVPRARHHHVEVEVPKGVALSWHVAGIELEPKRRQGGRHLVFDHDGLAETPARYAGAPVDAVRWPVLRFATGLDWQQIARHYGEAFDAAFTGAPPEAWTAEVAAAEGDDARIAAAYRIARDELRYTGVELGQQSILPRDLGAIAASGYGDCKEKAGVLVALLDGVGIEADIALLSAAGLDVEPSTPGFDAFDHAIVRVGDLWLDPTASTVPVGVLPGRLERRHALVVNPATEGLVQIAPLAASTQTYAETRRLTLPVSGRASVRERTEARGWPAVNLMTDIDPDAGADTYGEYLADAYAGATPLTATVTVTDGVTAPAAIELTAEDSRTGVSWLDGAQAWVSLDQPVTFLHGALRNEVPDDRVLDVHTRPFRAELTWIVEGPDGFVPLDLPANESERFGPLHWTTEWSVDGSTVTVRAALDAGDGVVSADAARALTTWMDRHTWDHAVNFTYGPTSRVAEGDLVGALAEADRLVAAHPDDLAYVGARMTVLSRIGLGRIAAEELTALVEQHPGDARLYDWKSYALSFDALGREFSPGFPVEAAVAATRAGLAIDPDHEGLHRRLGLLLLFDEQGNRWSPAAHPDEAVEVLRAIYDETGERGLASDIAMGLYITGRSEELVRFADEHAPSLRDLPIYIGALAASRGESAVRSHAATHNLSGTAVGQACAAALPATLQRGDYDTARTLVKLATSYQPGVITPTQIQGVERLADHRTRELDDLEQAWVALMQASLAGDPDEERKWLSKRVSDVRGTVGDNETNGFAPDALIDVSLALTRWVHRDPKVGARGDMSGPTGVLSMYFSHEKGQYKLRASSTHPAEVAQEALWHFAHKRDEAGVLWTQWAMEAAIRQGAGTQLAPLWARVDQEDPAIARVLATVIGAADSGKAPGELDLSAMPDREHAALREIYAGGLAVGGHEAEAKAAARELMELDPNLPHAIALAQLQAITGEEDAARAAAAALVEGGSLDERFAAMSVYLAVADTEAMLELARPLADEVPEHDLRANDVAWALLLGTEADQVRGLALARASLATGRISAPLLHTVAELQIATGDLAGALESARRSAPSERKLSPIFYGVLAEIAAELGFDAAARAGFQRTLDGVPDLDPSTVRRIRAAMEALDAG